MKMKWKVIMRVIVKSYNESDSNESDSENDSNKSDNESDSNGNN